MGALFKNLLYTRYMCDIKWCGHQLRRNRVEQYALVSVCPSCQQRRGSVCRRLAGATLDEHQAQSSVLGLLVADEHALSEGGDDFLQSLQLHLLRYVVSLCVDVCVDMYS